MPDQSLYAVSALDGLTMSEGQTHIREATAPSIVSIAVSNGALKQLDEKLNQWLGASFPVAGQANRANASQVLLGLQSDQCFLVSDIHWPDPVEELQSQLGGHAYLTDQSDSWAVLDLQGPLCRLALERLCPIDISAEVFTTSSVARTAMEHMSVIIEQPAEDQFRLYTPRSSAKDFAQALCTSLTNVGTYLQNI